MKHEDADVHFAQSLLTLAHDMRRDKVHALSILRKCAAACSAALHAGSVKLTHKVFCQGILGIRLICMQTTVKDSLSSVVFLLQEERSNVIGRLFRLFDPALILPFWRRWVNRIYREEW